MTSVAVVGSANLDLVIGVDLPPEPGETILGNSYSETEGGKGLNQALASARIVDTAFIGVVGDDAAGRTLGIRLEDGGVGTQQVQRLTQPTGRAVVVVTAEGENSIVVLPLANGALTPEHVHEALRAEQPRVVLCQLEIPLDAVAAAEQWCRDNAARFILNPSPVAALPAEILRAADPLIVNRPEAEALLRSSQGSQTGAELAQALSDHVRSVVVTGGSEGAWVAARRQVSHIDGLAVPVTDTTGAGDCFAGTLAAHLALGEQMVEAARKANSEAARVVQLSRHAR